VCRWSSFQTLALGRRQAELRAWSVAGPTPQAAAVRGGKAGGCLLQWRHCSRHGSHGCSCGNRARRRCDVAPAASCAAVTHCPLCMAAASDQPQTLAHCCGRAPSPRCCPHLQGDKRALTHTQKWNLVHPRPRGRIWAANVSGANAEAWLVQVRSHATNRHASTQSFDPAAAQHCNHSKQCQKMWLCHSTASSPTRGRSRAN
jgi:hypothetical protein